MEWNVSSVAGVSGVSNTLNSIVVRVRELQLLDQVITIIHPLVQRRALLLFGLAGQRRRGLISLLALFLLLGGGFGLGGGGGGAVSGGGHLDDGWLALARHLLPHARRSSA